MSRTATGIMDIELAETTLEGDLRVPEGPEPPIGLVVFAHGSGSSRKSPRNNAVAEELREEGLATLLFDLLTEEEDVARENRFDIPLLERRLVAVTDWVGDHELVGDLDVGYFGASTGAAAALRAAVERPAVVDAVVSRGGRVDMADEVLPEVAAGSLFVVGGDDDDVLELNREAYDRLTCEKDLVVIPGAGHLFEGPGELKAVSGLAAAWFCHYLD
ncbi:dienelactone hydrolase family protein [Haloparvum sp. AD34]